MRRVAPCLILLLAPTLAWAAVGASSDPDRAPCVDTPSAASRGALPDVDAGSSAHPGGPRTHAPATTQGGGSDGDLVLPKMRMPRWHSFLPGMFR